MLLCLGGARRLAKLRCDYSAVFRMVKSTILKRVVRALFLGRNSTKYPIKTVKIIVCDHRLLRVTLPL